MSKKTFRLENLYEVKSRPTILRRKRKAECNEELDNSLPSHSKHSVSDITNTTFAKSSLTTALHFGGPTFSQFRGLASLTPQSCYNGRGSPLPNINWGNPQDVWDLMVQKDAAYPRNHAVFLRHPELQPRMRAILLDWLIEVCEVYKLHRETFYLAQDFIDRYLGVKCNIPKTQLQLIGITALFIAAKMEEIYPPKLTEFAYVTDGACTESEILDKELIMLKFENGCKILGTEGRVFLIPDIAIGTLKWDLTPITVNSWLSAYLQLASNMETHNPSFLLPEFSAHVFAQVAQLLDLCVLDVACLQFSYGIMAASALYYKSSKKLTLSVSGLQWSDLIPCVKWMEPFAQTVKENGVAQLKFFNKIDKDDLHNIQIHNTDLTLFEKAQSLQLSRTPVRANCDSGIKDEALTPPHSIKKKCMKS